jgi:Flp pilus assembly pilin Flp
MISKYRGFQQSCDGQDIVEYAILVAVLAVAGIVAFSNFGKVISDFWDKFTALLAS